MPEEKVTTPEVPEVPEELQDEAQELQDKLESMKEQYGALHVMRNGRDLYAFRVIPNNEYNDLVKSGKIRITDEETANADIVKNSLVMPDYDEIDFDKEPPGLKMQLATVALRIHGFVEPVVTEI